MCKKNICGHFPPLRNNCYILILSHNADDTLERRHTSQIWSHVAPPTREESLLFSYHGQVKHHESETKTSITSFFWLLCAKHFVLGCEYNKDQEHCAVEQLVNLPG